MSKADYVRRHTVEKKTSWTREQDQIKTNQNFLSKHLKRIYPIGIHKSNSSLSLSSFSLSLSQNSDSSQLTADSTSTLEQKISLALHLIAPHQERKVSSPKHVQQQQQQKAQDSSGGELRRCNWITKNSDKVYVSFHDEQWGVPVYDDNQLFELLAMAGMLMDYNWTEILKRKQIFRKAFCGFDPNMVAKMGEKEIADIAYNKSVMLQESRVRCIVDNAKCIVKMGREYGSFSNYIWSHVKYKPVINKYKYSRNVPLRSPKAEAMSRDMMKHGFRFVGPVIVYSFMQAAGLTIDHLVDCFRHNECVGLAERPWRHI